MDGGRSAPVLTDSSPLHARSSEPCSSLLVASSTCAVTRRTTAGTLTAGRCRSGRRGLCRAQSSRRMQRRRRRCVAACQPRRASVCLRASPSRCICTPPPQADEAVKSAAKIAQRVALQQSKVRATLALISGPWAVGTYLTSRLKPQARARMRHKPPPFLINSDFSLAYGLRRSRAWPVPYQGRGAGSRRGRGMPPYRSLRGSGREYDYEEGRREPDSGASHALRLRLMMGNYRGSRTLGVLENKLLASVRARAALPTQRVAIAARLPLLLSRRRLPVPCHRRRCSASECLRWKSSTGRLPILLSVRRRPLQRPHRLALISIVFARMPLLQASGLPTHARDSPPPSSGVGTAHDVASSQSPPPTAPTMGFL